MKRLFIAILILLWAGAAWARAVNVVVGQAGGVACSAAYIEDSFTRSDSGTIGGSWTSETDTGSLLAISSGKMVFTHSATTQGKVLFERSPAVTESWLQFKYSVSDANTGSGNAAVIVQPKDAGGSTSYQLELDNNSSGDITSLILKYRNDSNSVVTASTWAISPTFSGATEYTIKVHSAGGASSTGYIDVYWDGTRVINATGLAYDTYSDIDEMNIGNMSSAWTDTDFTVSWDDIEWRSDDCFN